MPILAALQGDLTIDHIVLIKNWKRQSRQATRGSLIVLCTRGPAVSLLDSQTSPKLSAHSGRYHHTNRALQQRSRSCFPDDIKMLQVSSPATYRSLQPIPSSMSAHILTAVASFPRTSARLSALAPSQALLDLLDAHMSMTHGTIACSRYSINVLVCFLSTILVTAFTVASHVHGLVTGFLGPWLSREVRRLEKRTERFRNDCFWHFMVTLLNPYALYLVVFWPGWVVLGGLWVCLRVM